MTVDLLIPSRYRQRRRPIGRRLLRTCQQQRRPRRI